MLAVSDTSLLPRFDHGELVPGEIATPSGLIQAEGLIGQDGFARAIRSAEVGVTTMRQIVLACLMTVFAATTYAQQATKLNPEVRVGVRRTQTIAAGVVGNERPIVVTTDERRSPDLKVLMLSDYYDPRTGTSTYKLVNVSRIEPAASLFEVPADYAVMPPIPGGR